MKNKVIVFGGTGFLGGYLVDELENRGYTVYPVDLNNPKNHPNYISCDIMDKSNVSDIITEDVGYVFNLAGFANLDVAIKYPIRTMELNVIGNMNILEACINKNVKRFIYASSAYAMSNKGSFYGISKLSSEKIVEEYGKRYGLKYTILRYGSVYSEVDFDNNYIFQIVKKAVKNKSIEHQGTGEELREYIHAFDAAKLSVDVIESKNFENEHVILTGMEKMRRLDLFLMIKEILNDDVEIFLKEGGYKSHYKLTPYSFEPIRSRKLVANPHIDMGQGILDCIKAVYNSLD
jgi:UDP-glucose 4-epimerase